MKTFLEYKTQAQKSSTRTFLTLKKHKVGENIEFRHGGLQYAGKVSSVVAWDHGTFKVTVKGAVQR